MEKIFLERLRLARGERNQTESSKILGISQVRLSNYESGRREPDLSTLKRIAKIYSVSLDWLLGLSDERSGGRVVTGSGGAIVVGGDANSSFNSPATSTPPALDELRAQVSDLRAQLAARDATIDSLAATLRAISSARPSSIIADPKTPYTTK